MGVLLLLLIGVGLSAFFSGTETGFYRVTRVRLMLDALGGDLIARALLWLTNHPALFVATTLIGNNLANYMTSLGIVLAVRGLPLSEWHLAEFIAPVLLSPIVFVYVELLPKNVFFHAPNALLRRSGWLFLLFAVLFAPVSALVWALGRILQGLLGQTPLRVRLTLARKELQEVLQEGREAGILKPAQQSAVHNLFGIAARNVTEFSTPVARVPSIRPDALKSDVLRMARRHRVAAIPVSDRGQRKLVGYVRVVDLQLKSSAAIEPIRPLVSVRSDESTVSALIRLRNAGESLASVVDPAGATIGLLYLDDLTDPVFRSP